MPFKECEISDMLRERAKAWQGVPCWQAGSGFWRSPRSLGRRLRGSSLSRTASRKLEEHIGFQTTLVRYVVRNDSGIRKLYQAAMLLGWMDGPLGGA